VDDFQEAKKLDADTVDVLSPDFKFSGKSNGVKTSAARQIMSAVFSGLFGILAYVITCYVVTQLIMCITNTESASSKALRTLTSTIPEIGDVYYDSVGTRRGARASHLEEIYSNEYGSPDPSCLDSNIGNRYQYMDTMRITRGSLSPSVALQVVKELNTDDFSQKWETRKITSQATNSNGDCD
jgi:hypothetical protein